MSNSVSLDSDFECFLQKYISVICESVDWVCQGEEFSQTHSKLYPIKSIRVDFIEISKEACKNYVNSQAR